MYLKSLEIFGFKSFAPKTVLNFDPGVTCVVGPNGCGKSNVLDSIRWVLGEQSAKALRGGEMTDVIFSGTDSRPALGMAEVSMTFSECEEQLGLDWHEVKITRRVFREGGSEYLLNGTPCRLKDIHTLFMDTGIGRSAYSIMEQGKIDLILSSRPEDRRAIFEEAAGITKYKFQRKEALRKLEATEVNLVRLADIIKEVKRQIGSVQRQAAKARRYQGMLEDLRTLETHQAKRQFDELDGSRASNMVELEALSVRHYESEIAVSAKEEEANAQRAAVEEMEGRLNSARQTVQDLRARIANHESRLSFNTERATEFASLMERYRVDIAGAEEKFRMAETQLRDMDGEMEQITELLASELRRMEEVQAQASGMSAQRQQADAQISAMNNEAARAESRLGSLRAQTGTVLQQREAAEARLAALAGEIGQLEFAFARANEELASTQAELGRMIHELEERTAALSGAEVHHRDAQAKVGEVDIEMRETLRVLADRESRLQVLKQLNDGGEGLSEGTQAVLRGLDNAEFFKPAIHGALAQCMDVAPEFIPAVEAVLGAQLQTIVMKDTMVAESVIKTLTSQKLGKASLALRDLDSVFVHVRNETMQLPEGAIDWLINKIKPQPEVARLMERLVNHTVLVPDLATALRVFSQIRGSAVVTLTGEVITGHGILQGGAAAGENNSILARRNQIAALESEIAAVREQLAAQQVRHEAATLAVENGRHAIDETRLEKENATVQVSTLRNQVQLLERERGEGEKRVMTLDIEKQNADARLAEANQRTTELEAEIKASMDQFESCIACRAEAQQAIETLRAQENEIVSDLNELKVKVATERQRHSLLHHQRVPMEARIEELEQLMQERRNDIRNYDERGTALQAENAEIEANMERLRGSIGEAEAEVAALQEERHVITASAQEIAEALRDLRREQSHCVEQRGALEVRVTQLELRANAIHDHISKRYQVDLREFTPDSYALNACVRDIGKRVRKLDAQTESSGAGAGDAGAGDEGAEAAHISAVADDIVDNAGAQDAQEAGEAQAPQIDWARIETIVRELDTRLASMGPVNLDAIAEFEELEQRHTFLEQQIGDTIAAKQELTDVINKINTTTKTLFADTFEKIRVNFQEMFKELFGGGQANLVLSMEEDPLESGIEIIAKPPGKQLQSITLLSGGEKTMTAVALLFSIYMVKPSPFCVLDEMDAPLDESNISRFIKILDRFVAQSQFVVISHNKRTIARADALYGVTMEEHGVSKLVGVKFRARNEAHEGRDILGGENATPVPSIAEAFGKSGDLHSEGVAAVEEAGGAA